MIKHVGVEGEIARLEWAVDGLWRLRRERVPNGPPIGPVDLYDAGAGDYLIVLSLSFNMPSPVLGNMVVCADLSAEDVSELHRRFYAVMEKIRRFEMFFFYYCVGQICRDAEQTYRWFIQRVQLPEVPAIVQPV